MDTALITKCVNTVFVTWNYFTVIVQCTLKMNSNNNYYCTLCMYCAVVTTGIIIHCAVVILTITVLCNIIIFKKYYCTF